MAGDLTAADVVEFTGGRLANTIQVQNMLKAAILVARRDAGWHVNPVRLDQDVTLDGPDSRILYLPTKKLVELVSVEEDGYDIAPLSARLSWSVGDIPDRPTPVRVRKRGGGVWSAEYGSIVVTMEHGYTDDEARDWRQGVLSMVDQMGIVITNADAGALTRKQIDDVAYSYQPYITLAEETLYSMGSIFENFRLPDMDFV